MLTETNPFGTIFPKSMTMFVKSISVLMLFKNPGPNEKQPEKKVF